MIYFLAAVFLAAGLLVDLVSVRGVFALSFSIFAFSVFAGRFTSFLGTFGACGVRVFCATGKRLLSSASFVINASAPPTVLTSGDVDICQGNSTTLSAAGASTYAWSPATALSATTGSSVVATPLSTITYQVIGTDASNCSDTAYITVTVNPLPFVFTPPAPAICSGGTVTVSITGADYYHWSPQTGLSNPNGPDSSSVSVTLTSTTTYTVTGFTAEGCSASATVTVTVNPNPQPVIVALGNTKTQLPQLIFIIVPLLLIPIFGLQLATMFKSLSKRDLLV